MLRIKQRNSWKRNLIILKLTHMYTHAYSFPCVVCFLCICPCAYTLPDGPFGIEEIVYFISFILILLYTNSSPFCWFPTESYTELSHFLSPYF